MPWPILPPPPREKNEGDNGNAADRLNAFVNLWSWLLLGGDPAHLLAGVCLQAAKWQHCLVKERLTLGSRLLVRAQSTRATWISAATSRDSFDGGIPKAIWEPGTLLRLSGWFIHVSATCPRLLFLGIKLFQIFPWPSSFHFNLKVTKDIYPDGKLNVGAAFIVETIKSMP